MHSNDFGLHREGDVTQCGIGGRIFCLSESGMADFCDVSNFVINLVQLLLVQVMLAN